MRYAHALLTMLLSGVAAAAPVFDVHVHLREGETSLRAYEADAKAAGIELAGIGAMWFGGPNQARQGETARIHAGNDGVIALASRHETLLPIATVHPYDGAAAIDELTRVAEAGVKVLKLHAHTQRFDVADPRVEALVRKAGALGVTVLLDNANILPGDSEKLFNLVVAVPQTRFILAHIGGLNFRFWNPGAGADRRRLRDEESLLRRLGDRDRRRRVAARGRVRLDAAQCRHRPGAARFGLSADQPRPDRRRARPPAADRRGEGQDPRRQRAQAVRTLGAFFLQALRCGWPRRPGGHNVAGNRGLCRSYPGRAAVRERPDKQPCASRRLFEIENTRSPR